MVLIDTWWNVNLVEKIGKVVTDIVLIDTWWNVNSYILQSSSAHCPVLIDTWWNVNNNAYFIMTVENSFNRYMVECEFVYKDSVSDVVNGFNRYMVECELFCVGTERQGRTVLIDTW